LPFHYFEKMNRGFRKFQKPQRFFCALSRCPGTPSLETSERPNLLQFCAANEPLRIERTTEGDIVVMTPAGGKTGNKEGYIFRELDL